MKKYLTLIGAMVIISNVWAQNNKYPDPEFTNEVYLYRKDSANKLLRLEKGSSKMETKTKAGGMGGAENGYSMDGEKSIVRTKAGSLSFVFSTGETTSSSSKADSVMRANGIDPSLMSAGSMMDPATMITLYKAETSRGKRKITMMKTPGMLPFGSKKISSSDKLSFSVKKIKNGYWEMVVDKPLTKGEYIFSMMSRGMNNMDGGVTLFALGVD